MPSHDLRNGNLNQTAYSLFLFIRDIANGGQWLFAQEQPQNPCALPSDLHDEITKKYPGTHLVTLADLDEYNRKLFRKDHGGRCPGLVKVDFYGDGRPTLALVLVPKGGANQNAELVIVHLVDGTWKIAALASGGPSIPVIWSLPPGKYTDVYGEKTIRATRPVIVFFQYKAWGILCAWTNNRVVKIWIAD